MAWQEDEPSFVSSVLAAGLVAEQPDRADNPCFGGLFPDMQPSIQNPLDDLRARGFTPDQNAIDYLNGKAKRTDPPVDVGTVSMGKRNRFSVWKALWAPQQPSSALGVHLSQIEQATNEAKSLGVPVEFLEDGRAVFKSARHRKQYMKVRCMRSTIPVWKSLWRRLVAHWTWIWDVGY